MEQYEYKALTLNILKQLLLEDEFRERTDIGMTIQAYLRDSKQPIYKASSIGQNYAVIPVTVRLVKGAYWDTETIQAAQQELACNPFITTRQRRTC